MCEKKMGGVWVDRFGLRDGYAEYRVVFELLGRDEERVSDPMSYAYDVSARDWVGAVYAGMKMCPEIMRGVGEHDTWGLNVGCDYPELGCPQGYINIFNEGDEIYYLDYLFYFEVGGREMRVDYVW